MIQGNVTSIQRIHLDMPFFIKILSAAIFVPFLSSYDQRPFVLLKDINVQTQKSNIIKLHLFPKVNY